MAKKHTLADTARVKTFAVVERAVEDGVRRGVHQFLKHRGLDTEDLDGLGEEVERAVMGELCEWIDFNPNDT